VKNSVTTDAGLMFNLYYGKLYIGVNVMQKVGLFFLLLGLCWFSGQSTFLYAQEDDDDDEDFPLDTDWDGYITDLYSMGDQTFTISLGVSFPVVSLNEGKKIPHHFKPPVGGTGSLAYSYFLGAHFFLGIEIGVLFNYTLGQNTLFLIPIGARAGTQFVIGRFEIPLYMSIGVALHRYLDNKYIGLFLKPGFSAYFRFSPNWSFGIANEWTWYPQWPKENGKRVPHKDIDAFFTSVTLAARYHF
jgi:hypothetical protein